MGSQEKKSSEPGDGLMTVYKELYCCNDMGELSWRGGDLGTEKDKSQGLLNYIKKW